MADLLMTFWGSLVMTQKVKAWTEVGSRIVVLEKVQAQSKRTSNRFDEFGIG
jgi:hypothetical protein